MASYKGFLFFGGSFYAKVDANCRTSIHLFTFGELQWKIDLSNGVFFMLQLHPMEPEQTITIDHQEYRVTICNATYANVELVENPRVTKMIKISDYEKML